MRYLITDERPEYDIDKSVLNKNMLYGTAKDNEICVACIAFEVVEKIIYIRYLDVLSEYRLKGIGTNLVDKIVEYVCENKYEGIVFNMRVSKDSKTMFERFLIKNDFHMPEYDGRIISLKIESINNSYLDSLKVDIDDIENRIHILNNLPGELKADYKNNIRPNIDSEYLIENIEGDSIPGLALALENKGRLSSYVVFSEYKGELFLDSVYVSKNNTIDLIRLLKYCLTIIRDKHKEYKSIKIKTLNYEGYYLFSKLTKGADVNDEYVLVTYRLV